MRTALKIGLYFGFASYVWASNAAGSAEQSAEKPRALKRLPAMDTLELMNMFSKSESIKLMCLLWGCVRLNRLFPPPQ
jgi:hypothetical protein